MLVSHHKFINTHLVVNATCTSELEPSGTLLTQENACRQLPTCSVSWRGPRLGIRTAPVLPLLCH